ncbi:B12-binding domain-containing radical SAM protein [Athalassotoga sp.]|uniref:B12-binding domain-containing radical SAM protein n=1 Tax=Athalassotoga sp. TaxID=2022597 RepID=UPI003CFF1CBE
MKALLVNPYIHDVSAYDFWLKPVGLLYIAKALRVSNFDVKLLDLLDRNLPGNDAHDGPYGTGKFHSEIIGSLKTYGIPRYMKRYGAPLSIFDEIDFDPDVILVTSMMTYWYGGVFETIKLLKERFKVPVILGGNYVTLLPDHAKKSGADFVISGDGIPKIYEVLEKIFRKKIPEPVGIDWFEKITPDYSLYDKLDAAVVHTTYGCPFRCTYCVAWQRGFKSRSVGSVIEEIESLKKMGIKDLAFYDDAILVDKVRFKEILKALPSGIRYHLPNGIHAIYVDEEIAALMMKKNFKTIRIGYETGDPYLQKQTGGKVTNAAFEKAVDILKNNGFTNKELGAYLIIGLPGQTFESAMEDVKSVIDLGVKPFLNEYTLIPGSVDWEEAVSKGEVSKDLDPLVLKGALIHYWWKNSMGIKHIEKIKRKVQEFYLSDRL